jgi:hypothetical protein
MRLSLEARRRPDVDPPSGGHARERSVTELILAYIDPGSGSLIIQVVIASLVAIPVFFRNQIGRLLHLARGRREVESPVDDRVDRD